MGRHRARQRKHRSIALIGAVALLVGALSVPVAVAQTTYYIEIPIDTIVKSNAPGILPEDLATVQVAPEFEGQECSVRSVGGNQESEHPNNDLIVRSGSSEVVIPDVEADPGATVEGTGTLTLGSSIAVFLRMGEDLVFSAGLTVVVDCTPPTPPSGWACVEGDVVFIEDATDFEGTLYDTEEAAAADPDCAEVSASTTFTISGSCAVVDGEAVYTISGNLGEGLTLEVAGQTLDSSGAFIVDVGADGDFAYEVTLDDGFVLADDSPPAEGTVSIEDCTVPPPPSGWACVAGDVVFIEDASDFDGTLYDTEQEAAAAPGCTDEVLASIVVTVDSSCDVVDGDGQGQIDVSVSVDGGATVVIRDSDGDVITTVTEDASIVVEEGATYTWEATPNEGFEFPAGSPTSGTITIDTCTEVLPFTGPNTELLVALGVSLLGAGTAVLASQRRRQRS